jgi:hypothetical protein
MRLRGLQDNVIADAVAYQPNGNNVGESNSAVA